MLGLDTQGTSPERTSDHSWMDLPEEVKGAIGFDLGGALEASLPLERDGYGEVVFEKIGSFDDIVRELKENGYSPLVFPNFNYELGAACMEVSLIDEAIEQFKIALETGQNPAQTTRCLAQCYREKGLLDEAQRHFDQIQDLGEEPEALQFESRPSDLSSEVVAAESAAEEVYAVDTISLLDLEIQKRLAPYGSCLKFPQGYSV